MGAVRIMTPWKGGTQGWLVRGLMVSSSWITKESVMQETIQDLNELRAQISDILVRL